MFNKAILCGRLTKNPEKSVGTSGTVVARFTLAIDRRFNRNETDFLNIVAFNKTAEFVSKYFTKGQMVLVSGSIQNRSWEGVDGQKRYATDIIADEVSFFESKKDDAVVLSPEEAKETFDELKNDGFMPIDNDDALPWG